MQALFDALDLSLVTTNVSTALIVIIGIGMLFVGYSYVRKIMGRAR